MATNGQPPPKSPEDKEIPLGYPEYLDLTTKGKIYETMKSKLEEIKAQSPMEKVRIDKTPEILAVVAKLADLQLPEIYEFDDFINYLAHSNKYIKYTRRVLTWDKLLEMVEDWSKINMEHDKEEELDEEDIVIVSARRNSLTLLRNQLSQYMPQIEWIFKKYGDDTHLTLNNLPLMMEDLCHIYKLRFATPENLESLDQRGIWEELRGFLQMFTQKLIKTREEMLEPTRKLTYILPSIQDPTVVDMHTFVMGLQLFLASYPDVVVVEHIWEGFNNVGYEPRKEQEGIDDYDMIKKKQHYFDVIHTDEYIMPTSFEVEIQLADNQIKNVTVEVEKSHRRKPFLGGFKQKRTGLFYHNAYAQTDQYEKSHTSKNHREVQTHINKQKSTIMMREFSSQTPSEGLHIDMREAITMEPQEYFTSEMWLTLRVVKTLFMQCWWRQQMAKKEKERRKKEREDRDMEIIKTEENKRKKLEETHKAEIERRMHPRSEQDFDILLKELDAWRLSETEKIKKSKELSEAEKKMALSQLLNKETKLLQTIDRLKITASHHNREDRISKFLEAMANPKVWKRTDGRYTEVHTPYTTRAKELMDLYNGLKMPFLSIDERLDILLHTKWTVKEFDCALTREIVDLIDREADMLNRGRAEKSLEGLRKRLCNLFLHFIEHPGFNPEAARFQKVPIELLNEIQTENFLE